MSVSTLVSPRESSSSSAWYSSWGILEISRSQLFLCLLLLSEAQTAPFCEPPQPLNRRQAFRQNPRPLLFLVLSVTPAGTVFLLHSSQLFLILFCFHQIHLIFGKGAYFCFRAMALSTYFSEAEEQHQLIADADAVFLPVRPLYSQPAYTAIFHPARPGSSAPES